MKYFCKSCNQIWSENEIEQDLTCPECFEDLVEYHKKNDEQDYEQEEEQDEYDDLYEDEFYQDDYKTSKYKKRKCKDQDDQDY